MISNFSFQPFFLATRMIAFFTAIALCSFACDTPPPVQEPRPDRLSKAICSCSNQLLLLNQAHATKSDSLSFREIFLEFEKTKVCIAALGIQPDDRIVLDASMLAHCPALAAEKELLRELIGD